jgi:hypothetical protein
MRSEIILATAALFVVATGCGEFTNREPARTAVVDPATASAPNARGGGPRHVDNGLGVNPISAVGGKPVGEINSQPATQGATPIKPMGEKEYEGSGESRHAVPVGAAPSTGGTEK